ncbi:MAG: EamA family transporter, partial [Actinobacteria bacterium]|nr:EamA family transporter [Actinomycetota bacterium]
MDSDAGDRRTGATLAVASVASVQFGAALAATLFSIAGPVGTVSLRLIGASAVLVALTRPWRRRWTGAEFGAALLFGAVFTAMNTALYLAIDRLPLATVITLEFLGPLGVAVFTASGFSVRLWAVPAVVGVVLLGGSPSGGDLLGVVFALTAAACWAGYILLSGRIGRTGTGLAGLAVAGTVSALAMLPAGALTAGEAMIRPGPLATGLAVGVLSSAIPYSLDLLALRRLPTSMFGVLTSLNPAVAALAGLLVLDQRLAARDLLGIALVMTASVGVTLSPGRSWSRRSRVAARRSVVVVRGPGLGGDGVDVQTGAYTEHP